MAQELLGHHMSRVVQVGVARSAWEGLADIDREEVGRTGCTALVEALRMALDLVGVRSLVAALGERLVGSLVAHTAVVAEDTLPVDGVAGLDCSKTCWTQ